MRSDGPHQQVFSIPEPVQVLLLCKHTPLVLVVSCMWLITRHTSSINDWKILNLLCHWHKAGRICSISLLIRKNTWSFSGDWFFKILEGKTGKSNITQVASLTSFSWSSSTFYKLGDPDISNVEFFQNYFKDSHELQYGSNFFLLLWIYIPIFFVNTAC